MRTLFLFLILLSLLVLSGIPFPYRAEVVSNMTKAADVLDANFGVGKWVDQFKDWKNSKTGEAAKKDNPSEQN